MVNRTNNVNEIVIGDLDTNFNNNTNDKYERSRKVENIADALVEKLGNPGGRQFYCKVAWKLSEARIWSNVEQALVGRQPARLFTYLCKRDGV